jgi:hypothetical protein
MKDRVNTYFAILLITIAGAGASLLIIHVAYANTFTTIIQHDTLQGLQ